MQKEFLILDLAHSLHGRVKRIRVSYKSLAYTGASLLAIVLVLSGLVTSYLWMRWKVSNYDRLQADFDRLRTRYVELQRESNQHQKQMASLETLASEVSTAYGLSQPSGEDSIALDSDSMPNLKSSLAQFTYLQSASFSSIFHHYSLHSQLNNQPSLWPVAGILRSSFGVRTDPFSGEGAFHSGLDLQVPTGTPVHAAADGVVETAGWSGRYGKLVVLNHGNGIQTFYGHLSQVDVVPGQEVRRGEVVALSGMTGHATGPHVHYEVRLGGTPVNPYRYLSRTPNLLASEHTRNDLGL